MIKEAKHIYIQTRKVVAYRGLKRNPSWEHDSRLWLKDHNECAATGWTYKLQIHHVLPFHLFPQLEMDESNWIVLTENPLFEAHFEIGHNKNWREYNIHVRIDAMMELKRRKDSKGK